MVITGTQLGAWGRDFDQPLKPHELIRGVLQQTDVPRLRFSSLQPQDITPELLALWEDPRLMPHFHLALQSGSDAVLTAMRRRYTAREFVQAAERIRAAVPHVAITTDVIAGFPGETEEQFAETLELCAEVRFSRLHCFPYSQRSRTAAARFPAQVHPEVRKERMARLLALGDELSRGFRSSYTGTTRPVLWEGTRGKRGDDVLRGYTDNYISVYRSIPQHADETDMRNRLTPAILGELYDDGVRGYLAGDPK